MPIRSLPGCRRSWGEPATEEEAQGRGYGEKALN